jgi:hypothetical protein
MYDIENGVSNAHLCLDGGIPCHVMQDDMKGVLQIGLQNYFKTLSLFVAA